MPIRVSRRLARAIAAVLMLAVPSVPVHAQILDADDIFKSKLETALPHRRSVRHPDDVFTANSYGRSQPLRIGSFEYATEVEAGAIFDSNIFNREFNVVSDLIWAVRPTLSMRSLLPRHAVWADFGAAHFNYLESSEDTFTDVFARFGGTLNVRSDLDFVASFSAARLHEQRDNTDRDVPADAAEPIPRTAIEGRVGFNKRFNRLRTGLFVSYENEDRDAVRRIGGGQVSVDHRDFQRLQVEHVANFTWTPRLRAFNRTSMATSEYRDVPGRIDRDSTRVETVTGIVVSFTPVIFGELRAGFADEDFHSPLRHAEPEQAYKGVVTWWPRTYLRLKAYAFRRLGGIDFTEDAASKDVTGYGLNADYAPSPHLVLRAGIGHSRSEFQSSATDRLVEKLGYHASITRYLDINSELSLQYLNLQRDSTRPGDSADRQIVQGVVSSRF